MIQANDKCLIEGYLNGDESCFNQFYDRHFHRVHSIVKMMTNRYGMRHMEDDIVQETWLKLIKNGFHSFIKCDTQNTNSFLVVNVKCVTIDEIRKIKKPKHLAQLIYMNRFDPDGVIELLMPDPDSLEPWKNIELKELYDTYIAKEKASHIKQCVHCGSTMHSSNYRDFSKFQTTKYCNKTCYYDAIADSKKKKTHKVCNVCGKEFTNYAAKSCSVECANIQISKTMKERFKK